MENIRLLFEKNNAERRCKYEFTGRRLYIPFLKNEIGGDEIKELISLLNEIRHRYKGINIPICIDIGNVVFADKLTYIMLECILYEYIVVWKHDICIIMNPAKNIEVAGIETSVLSLLRRKTKEDRAEFKKQFSFKLLGKHKRFIVRKDESSSKISEKYDDMYVFLKALGIEEECCKQVAEVVEELLSNANEHSGSDCLIDLDVTNYYKKLENGEINGEDYYGINIAVVNFSDILFETKIKRKMIDSSPKKGKYGDVSRAYRNHIGFFDSDYIESDFYIVTSYQDRVTGRADDATGGTGLTKLLQALAELSDYNKCYMITGNRALYFREEYMKRSDGWIGFNETGDYIEKPPSKNVIGVCPVYIPGTGYNLHFVMKKEK